MNDNRKNIVETNLPEGWDYIPISRVVLKTQQKDPSKNPNEEIKYVDVSGVSNESFSVQEFSILKGKDAPSRARKVIATDDVIFATVRPTLKRVAIIEEQLNDELCSTGYCVLKANDSLIDYRFLYFFLLTDFYINQIEKLQRGASYPAVRDSDVKGIKIPLPKLREQRTISHILFLIQTAIQKQDEIIQTTTELKNTLMQILFTKGIKNEKQKETEIGIVPESWKVVELNKTGEVIYGIQAAVANNTKPIGTKILTNINISLDGKIDLKKVRYYKLKSKRDFNTILQQGDILFNWRSGSKEHVGKTALFNLKDEYTHSSFILRIRPNEKVENYFLYLYLNYLRATGYFIKQQTYSINAKFNKSAIELLPVALPLIDEQKVIAETIRTANEKLEHHETKKQTLTQLFKTLLHKLMTGEIRVKDLDLRNEYPLKEETLSIAAEPSE